MLWKINNFLEMHFPSMKVILKNDWGNHFCIDSESGREGKNNLWLNAYSYTKVWRIFFFVGPGRIYCAILQNNPGNTADLGVNVCRSLD